MAYLEKHKIPRLFEILGVKLAQQVGVCLTQTWETESFLGVTFEQSTAHLIYVQKPASPNDFIIEELSDIAESKSKTQPVGVATTWAVQVYSCLASQIMTKQLLSPAQVSIFNDDDIDIIFGIFDVTNRGYLDSTQLTKGNDNDYDAHLSNNRPLKCSYCCPSIWQPSWLLGSTKRPHNCPHPTRLTEQHSIISCKLMNDTAIPWLAICKYCAVLALYSLNKTNHISLLTFDEPSGG